MVRVEVVKTTCYTAAAKQKTATAKLATNGKANATPKTKMLSKKCITRQGNTLQEERRKEEQTNTTK